ncbi:hypothetical protein Tco_0497490 [Tanacetum coccineum]
MGSPMTQPLQELKTGDVKVTLKLPSHCDPTEVEVESTFFNMFSREKVDAPFSLLLFFPNDCKMNTVVVQWNQRARTTLLSLFLMSHVADFHSIDDARDIRHAVQASLVGNVESKKMRKSMLKQNF